MTTQAQPYTCGNCGAAHPDLFEHCPCQPGPVARKTSRAQALQQVATDHLDNADATLEELADALKPPEDMSWGSAEALKLIVRRQTVLRCRAALELVRETVDGLVLD